MKKILVLAPHPDDELLGCGGTLLRHKAEGDELAWLIITNILETEGYSTQRIEERQTEIGKVAQALSTKLYKLDLPTMKLSSETQFTLINKISRVFEEFQPEYLYLPYQHDIHSDHYYSFQAALACTKSFRYPFIKKIMMYETLSETDFALPQNTFQPNIFINISSYLEEKLRILEFYQSELGGHPFPRSLENVRALAHLRGATAGYQAAESFMLVREII